MQKSPKIFPAYRDHSAGGAPEPSAGQLHQGKRGDRPRCDRYFNWQKWFECGTGPAGNQFTHEFDCVNQVLNLGIPGKVIAIGGNFYYEDPRDIPDVFNAVFEYPDKGLTLTYDCTLKNSKLRNKAFLGDKGSMEVNVGLAVYTDAGDEEPVFTYHPKTNVVDAVTSATTKYYEDRRDTLSII